MTQPARPITVAVLMGGPDAEREVSLNSGRQVLAALQENPELTATGHVVDRPTTEDLKALGVDVIFPVLHGPFGEGGVLQEHLERTGVPFVGSDAKASALAMDKCAAKRALLAEGVPTAQWAELTPGEPSAYMPPVVVKPVDEGSSVGVRMCHTEEELAAARAELEPKHPRLMAETFIDGRELTIGIVHGKLLPLIEIKTAVAFYDYEAKYERSDTEYILEPDVHPQVARLCHEFAEATWKCLGCRDVARVDFIADEAGPWVLEVNTMPGFTDHSLVPMAARHMGMPMTELCSSLVMAAHQRSGQNNPDTESLAEA